MDKNEWRSLLKQNDDKNSINPIALFFAFLVGAATAFVVAWRVRMSKNKKGSDASDEAADYERTQEELDREQADREWKELLRVLRRESELRMWGEREAFTPKGVDISGAKSPANVQTQQVMPYKPRKRVSAKKFFGRAVAVAVAAALMVTGLTVAPLDTAPVSTVQAKDSFGGIKQVVEEHDEENPFVILDIVPGKASATIDNKTYDFSLGTIGYLAPGQSPLQQDLVRIFTGDDAFYSYDKRIELTGAVIENSDSGLIYQEAYGGTGQDLRLSEWSLIFDTVEGADYDTDGSCPTGKLPARVEKRPDDSTGTLEGFDYDLISRNVPSGISDESDEDQPRKVSFEADEGLTSGFLLKEICKIADLKGSSDLDNLETTAVYLRKGDKYTYSGELEDFLDTVEDTVEPSAETDTNEEEEKSDESEAQPEITVEPPTETPPETPAETPPETPAETPPETPAETPSETPAETPSETPAETSSETPAETQPEAQPEPSVTKEEPTSEDASIRTQSVPEITGTKGGWYLCVNDGNGETENNETENDEIENNEIVPEEESYYCILEITYVPENEKEPGQILYRIKDDPTPVFTEINYAMMATAASADDTLADETFPKFEYVGPGQGQYKLTRLPGKTGVVAATYAEMQNDEEQDDDSQDNIARATLESGAECDVEVLNAPVYIKCIGGNDWLREYVFNSLSGQDNASNDFAIRVDTVLAGDVTYEMVQEADLVYLEDGEGLHLKEGATKKYIYTEEAGNGENGLADIGTTVITSLLYEAVEELKPVIVDYEATVADENYVGCNYKDSNYQKLAKAFLKKDLAGFYYDMAKSNDLAASVLMNVDNDSFPNKTDNDYHYVNRNVYIVNGTPLVGDDFPEEMSKDDAKAGFTEVLAAIQAENALLPEDERISEKVSKAMAVQYIINYSLGLIGEYKDLSILELQPTANTESDLHRDANEDKGSVVLYWQREDQNREGQQILRSSKMIETNVTISSVAAFNSSYQDINADYNMIFIGLDGQRLYREWDKDGKKSAVYNDKDLNGKVYHMGDLVADGSARYDANDITEQKKEALLDYLRAGYPIVVENECFKEGSAQKARKEDINTDYIASDTQMYAFLKEAISLDRSDEDDDETGIGIYTIEDVHSSALFTMQLNTQRPKIELWKKDGNTGENGDNTSGQEQISSDMIDTVSVPEKPGILRGTIDYRVSSDRTGEDKTYVGSLERHLYLDLNYDGVYAPEEEFTEYQYEDMEGGGRISVDFNEIKFGIVPWKLEVTDADNKYRRDAMQGCFTISGGDKAKIRVLQVLDNTTNDYANLQEQYENIENAMLAYYMKGAENLLRINWDIKTVTPADLSKLLAKNANYLSLWDVIVLGFGGSGNPGEAVTTAVNEYITAGGSVLVSSAGASADKERLGISTEVLGQKKDEQTYGKLGLNSVSQFRYEGISAHMFNETPSLYLDRINDGTISRWPYQIGTRAQLGANTEVSMPDYLLDIGTAQDAGQPYATAWFTLLDANTSNDSSKMGGYSVSPRDGRNNYYAYSKGNVVYVGQTEYKYVYDPKSGMEPEGDGVDECRIFVNALMAAYSAGVHRADVSIVAGFNGVSKIESVTVPYDVAFKEGGDEKRGILGETVDVYFRFTDNNIAVDKTTELALYYKNAGAGVDKSLLSADGTINTADYTQFTSPIWAVENNRLVEVTEGLVPDKVYRIKAPLLALQNGDDETSEICVLLTNRYTRAGKSVEAMSVDAVSLNRAQMFLLE